MVIVTSKKGGEAEPVEFNPGKYAMFDESRLLKLDLLAMIWIEENVIPGRAASIQTVINNLSRTGFLLPTLRAALGMVHGQPKVKAEEIQAIYDGFLQNTGNRADLEKLLNEVYEADTKNPTLQTNPPEIPGSDPGGNT